MARSSFILSLLFALATFVCSDAFVTPSSTAFRSAQLDRCLNTELAVNIKVNVGDGEPIESALRRFKREINKSGHLIELRHRRYFENSQEKVKRKIKEGRLRIKFERMQKRRMNQRAFK